MPIIRGQDRNEAYRGRTNESRGQCRGLRLNEFRTRSVLREDRSAEAIVKADPGDILMRTQFGLVSGGLGDRRSGTETGNRAVCGVSRLSQIDVKVFSLDRPLRRNHPLAPAADSPTDSRVVV